MPVVAMLAARRARTPYMVTFHTGGHTLAHRNALRAIQWRVIGPLLRNAAALVAVSHFEADSLSAQAHLGDRPVTVIRNGGTLPPPAPGTQVIPGRIVSSGRLERYKGHQRVIEALPDVIHGDPAAHLVIIGRGPYESELRTAPSGTAWPTASRSRRFPPPTGRPWPPRWRKPAWSRQCRITSRRGSQ